MTDLTASRAFEPVIEVIPPEREDGLVSSTCLCCQRSCSASMMDDDGCGICEE